MDRTIESSELNQPLTPEKTTLDELSEYYLKKEKGEFAITNLREMIVDGLRDDERMASLTSPSAEGQRDTQIDTYNFTKSGEDVITRVDNRINKQGSKVVTCQPSDNGHYRLIEGAEIYDDCEDPSITQIHGEDIICMIETYGLEGDSHCKEKFYRSKGDLTKKVLFAEGQVDEKDIRLQELEKPNKGIFRRPKEGEFGDGQIGWQTTTEPIENLQSVLGDNGSMKIIKKFAPDEWGGMNDSRMLNDGSIFFVGHMASLDRARTDPKAKKMYYGTAGIFDPKSEEILRWEIIIDEDTIASLAAEQGIKIESKNEEMGSVCYISSIIEIDEENDLITLGVSVQDTKSFEATIHYDL